MQGEVAIGLGMTSQAVKEINRGVPLEIIFFAEGSPFSMYGNAILSKSADRPEVRDVSLRDLNLRGGAWALSFKTTRSSTT